MRKIAAVGVVLVLAAWGGHVFASECTVRSVHDGDTLTAMCAGVAVKVRLVEIDAPERAQPYARRSANHVKAVCVGKPARLESPRPDKYGRTLARVYCAGVDVSADQVRRGYAWAFDKYLTDPEIKRLESQARADGRGLWAGRDPVPPWEFRHPGGR